MFQCNTHTPPCSLTCRCGTSSDVCLPVHVMGCGSLGCRPGWSGPTCQKQNIVYKATKVDSSSELSVSNSDNLAFDGDLTSVFRSAIEANPSVTVTATSSRHPIHTIQIYNGATDLNDLSGFEIYVSASSDFINSKLCYRDTTAIGKSEYVINCTQPLTGLYIKLLVPKTTSLAIREMEVYVCGEYWFGSECDRLCNCQSASTRCNGVTGACPYGCPDGRNGTDCYSECLAGRFGRQCQSICHCKNTASCDKVDGTCDDQGCAVGFKGDNCQRACSSGEFGEGCEGKCHCYPVNNCDKETGQCAGDCQAGFKGDNCQEDCEVGKYGRNCAGDCHCKNLTSCNKEHGRCDALGCEAGYTGSYCNRECSTGRFGEKCQYICHCKHAISCNHVNGTCDEGRCAAGYKGDNCQEVSGSTINVHTPEPNKNVQIYFRTNRRSLIWAKSPQNKETASIKGRPESNKASSTGLLAGVCVLAGISLVLMIYAVISTVKGRRWYIRFQQEIKSHYDSAQVPRRERSSEIYENTK
ncbi:multiple epidermal growth factor-like domains protein 10 isoform X3 [Liolophura sinensis]|uniref:multiple epidermal growth factor-like domains protein 10 isoform X3 n=1 Tax=Liolophura sinensis TaxID=3198878 RepID=UPI003158164F